MHLGIFIALLFASAAASPSTRCLIAESFKSPITKTDDFMGHWQMVHVTPLDKKGFQCPAATLSVKHVTNDDITYWKTKCLHLLDISILDETKFELTVVFPKGFDVPFTIIHRDMHGDQILLPSCVFGKIEFVKKGNRKMWIATTEGDGLRHPVAVALPDPEESSCILIGARYYHFC